MHRAASRVLLNVREKHRPRAGGDVADNSERGSSKCDVLMRQQTPVGNGPVGDAISRRLDAVQRRPTASRHRSVTAAALCLHSSLPSSTTTRRRRDPCLPCGAGDEIGLNESITMHDRCHKTQPCPAYYYYLDKFSTLNSRQIIIEH